MNYEPNIIDWAVGDLVIHDADAKTAEMLMRVVDIGLPDGRLKTEYANRGGNKKCYRNRKEVLHDPARFGIDVGESCTTHSGARCPHCMRVI